MRLNITFQEGRLEQAKKLMTEFYEELERSNRKSLFNVRQLGIVIPQPQVKLKVIKETPTSIEFTLVSVIDELLKMEIPLLPNAIKKRLHDKATKKIHREIKSEMKKNGLDVEVCEMN